MFGREAAYLLTRAVFIMFYRAGANKDICAMETKRKRGQHGKIKHMQTFVFFQLLIPDTHWLFITGINNDTGDRQWTLLSRTTEVQNKSGKHEITPYGRFP